MNTQIYTKPRFKEKSNQTLEKSNTMCRTLYNLNDAYHSADFGGVIARRFGFK